MQGETSSPCHTHTNLLLASLACSVHFNRPRLFCFVCLVWFDLVFFPPNIFMTMPQQPREERTILPFMSFLDFSSQVNRVADPLHITHPSRQRFLQGQSRSRMERLSPPNPTR